MKITYYGHSCLFIEAEGHKVIIDPFLKGNPLCDVNPESIEVDAVLLTHAHDDHFGDTLQIAKQNDCPVVAIFELAMLCQQRGVSVQPMNTGGSCEVAGMKVKLTPAFHSSSLFDNGQYLYAGQPVGMIITAEGKTIYHAGDTALFSDMKLIGDLHTIDVAALPIGDHFTMGPDEAVIAAEWVKAKQVLPLHYNTFEPIQQDAQKFADKLKEKHITGHVLGIGNSIEI